MSHARDVEMTRIKMSSLLYCSVVKVLNEKV
jgi:hypothetical protein